MSANQGCEKQKRRKRTLITDSQVKKLEHAFNQNQWPNRSCKSKLARDLRMSEHIINIWFQNKRARWKREEELARLNKSRSQQASATESDDAENSEAKAKTSAVSGDVKDPSSDVIDVSAAVPADNTSVKGFVVKQLNVKNISKIRLRTENKQAKSAETPSTVLHPATTLPTHLVLPIQPVYVPAAQPPPVAPRARPAPTLFQCVMAMMAVAEGGIVPTTDAVFDQAACDALYGININSTHLLVYEPDTGLELRERTQLA